MVLRCSIRRRKGVFLKELLGRSFYSLREGCDRLLVSEIVANELRIQIRIKVLFTGDDGEVDDTQKFVKVECDFIGIVLHHSLQIRALGQHKVR